MELYFIAKGDSRFRELCVDQRMDAALGSELYYYYYYYFCFTSEAQQCSCTNMKRPMGPKNIIIYKKINK